MNIKNEINLLKKDSNKNFNLALIFCTIILFIYCYFGTFTFFENTFTNCPNIEYWKIIYHNSMSFVLFFVIGLIFSKFVLKNDLAFIKFKFNNKKFCLYIFLAIFLITPIVALFSTLDKNMTSTYPLIDFSLYEIWQILLYFLSYFLYYIGWEFLFRGILFFNSKEKCGVVGTILLTTLISALIHTSIASFGKPMIETLSAIPAGLIFGYITFKSDNIYLSLLAHTCIGFLTDIFIFLLI